ncbi:hypothetical protein Tco_1374497, partial [Tanacetum coccineum]
MHGDQSPKTLNFQQQRRQSKPCKVYMKSYNAKPKSASACQPKIITGLTKDKTLEFKTKKPEESLLNWKPLFNDWAATTSKPKKVQDHTPEDNMYNYNRKGFLEDDDSSDDLIFIVDPRWDDYCLQELKLNRPLSLVDIPKQIWALHCMIACRLHMALTASFAIESLMSWATNLHALDLSILIGVWLALS